MNIRNHQLEIHCNQRDISDITQALIHSIIFFRTHGKFNYKHEGSYSIGTLGFERVSCEHLDFNYIRCSSQTLSSRIDTKLQEFADKFTEHTQSGTLSLEFYTKRPSRWPFNDSKIVWELWNIKLVLNPGTTVTQAYENQSSARLEEVLSDRLLDIVGIVNSDKCIPPQMPTQPNLDTVFDTSHSELQPYLYNLSYKISENFSSIHTTSPNSRHLEGNVVTDSSTQSTLKKFLLGTLEL